MPPWLRSNFRWAISFEHMKHRAVMARCWFLGPWTLDLGPSAARQSPEKRLLWREKPSALPHTTSFLEEGNSCLCQAHLCICLGLLQEELWQPDRVCLGTMSWSVIESSTSEANKGIWPDITDIAGSSYKSKLLTRAEGSNRLALQKRT